MLPGTKTKLEAAPYPFLGKKAITGAFRLHAEAFRSHAGTFRLVAEAFRSLAGAFRLVAGAFRSHAGAFRLHTYCSGNWFFEAETKNREVIDHF